MATLIDINDITDGSLAGTGSFDLLANAMARHLQREYEAGRINGADYGQVYLGGLQSAMAQSIQFELGRAQAGFSADLTEEQIKTQIEQTKLVTEQIDLAHAQHLKTEAETAVITERGGFR